MTILLKKEFSGATSQGQEHVESCSAELEGQVRAQPGQGESYGAVMKSTLSGDVSALQPSQGLIKSGSNTFPVNFTER